MQRLAQNDKERKMTIAIIIAGGVGSRMGADIPKQFVQVNGKPILFYTLEAFERHPMVDAIELVCIDGWQDTVQAYAKEYGIDTIEIHEDAINDKDVVLLHDDLLATGGTMKAACNLVRKFNPRSIMVNFLIEITDEGLHGRDVFEDDIEVTTLIKV